MRISNDWTFTAWLYLDQTVGLSTDEYVILRDSGSIQNTGK